MILLFLISPEIPGLLFDSKFIMLLHFYNIKSHFIYSLLRSLTSTTPTTSGADELLARLKTVATGPLLCTFIWEAGLRVRDKEVARAF